jgi:hypothetical protein
MLREIIIGISLFIGIGFVSWFLIRAFTHPRFVEVARNPYRNQMIERYGQERVEQIEKRRRERRGM